MQLVERDVSLAELAADKRASTPSNAAELLVPDKHHVIENVLGTKMLLSQLLAAKIEDLSQVVNGLRKVMEDSIDRVLKDIKHNHLINETVIEAYNPNELLKIGYAVVRNNLGQVVRSSSRLKIGDDINIKLYKGNFDAQVNKVSEV